MELVRTTLGSLLKPIATVLYGMVCAVPMPVVKGIFLGLIGLLAIWILSLKSEARDPENRRRLPLYRDLRLFAVLILALQGVAYALFG